MRRFPALSSAAALLALTASTPAHAAAFDATCAFVASTDAIAGQGQVTGVMAAALYTSDVGGNPATGQIRCYIKVNGFAQPAAQVSGSGWGVVPAAGVITFTSNSATDYIELCIDRPVADCREADVFELPPPLVQEMSVSVVCPVLALAASDAKSSVIDGDGDVYAANQLLFDCPPYITPKPPRTAVIWTTFGRW